MFFSNVVLICLPLKEPKSTGWELISLCENALFSVFTSFNKQVCLFWRGGDLYPSAQKKKSPHE